MNGSDPGTMDVRREHMAALDTLRHAKTMALYLAVVAILLHVGTWYIVRHTTLLDNANRAGASTAAAGSTADPEASAQARRLELRLETGLAIGGFVGRAAIVLILGLFVLSLLVSLSARLGGAAGMAKACVWSLLALALLVPWDRLAPDEVGKLPSAFYGMDELTRLPIDQISGTSDTGRIGAKSEWNLADTIRFAAYPLLIVLLVVGAQSAYATGYRRVGAAPTTRLPMREV